MDNIPATQLVRALQLLIKYNPEVAITAYKEQEAQAPIKLCAGRYTGHRMTEEESYEMGRLGWFASGDTLIGNEDAGTWEKSLYPY